MARPTFNLIEALSSLLKRIESGRQQLKAERAASENFWSAAKRRDKAMERLNEFLVRPVLQEEPARSEAGRELVRRRTELEKLNKEADDLWDPYTKTLAFITPFVSDLALLSERLPLKPEWSPLGKAIRALLPQIGNPGAWTDPPTNLSLETLELRLWEMLELAGDSRHVTTSEVPVESGFRRIQPSSPAIGIGTSVEPEGMMAQPKQPASTAKGGAEAVAEQTGSEVPVVTGAANGGKERRALRDAYRSECKQHGVRVTDVMIAEAASSKWHGRTAIQKWLACDQRYDGEPDRLIRSVFARKPHIQPKP
jgi:hypothetical protein